MGEGRRTSFTKGNFCPAFWKMGEDKELFLCCLIFLIAFRFKIILMPQLHILAS